MLLRGEDKTYEDRTNYLETITSSGQHLLELINGILDLSKIESGQLEIEKKRFSPDHVIADALSVLDVRARQKNLSLHYEWQGGVPETVLNDESRFRQALINLVGNAIKFTEEGGVVCRAQMIVENPPRLQVDVADTGIGIPKEKLEHIFVPFAQADSSVTRRFGGTGLGLAITKRIAELLGGSISVRSIEGRGSCFTISLTTGPLDGVPIRTSPVARIRSTTESATDFGTVNLSGRKILVVEDGETNRMLITIMLNRMGAHVDHATNGLAGVEKAMGEQFDLIFMDMQMPVMDGYSAATRLRELGCKVPIVALTAHALKGDREKCLAAGCSGYLTKPVDAKRLADVVRQELGERTVSNENPNATAVTPPREAKSRAPVEKPKTPAVPAAPRSVKQNRPAILSTLPVDDEDFRAIVAEFIVQLDGQIAEMKELLRNSDYDRLYRVAHTIRGTGGSVGFPCLTEPATELMEASKTNDAIQAITQIDAITELLSRFVVPKSAGPENGSVSEAGSSLKAN